MPAKKGQPRSKAISSYEKALTLLHKEDFTKALAAFQNIIETHSDERDLVSRSHAFNKLCETKLRNLEKPKKLSAHENYDQGILHHNRGAWDEAIEAFELSMKGIKKVVDRDFIHRALAATYARMGDTEQALSHLEKAIDSDEVHRFQARNDPDFETLSSDESFRNLVWPDQAA